MIVCGVLFVPSSSRSSPLRGEAGGKGKQATLVEGEPCLIGSCLSLTARVGRNHELPGKRHKHVARTAAHVPRKGSRAAGGEGKQAVADGQQGSEHDGMGLPRRDGL